MNAVWIGRDNALIYSVQEGAAAADLSAVTRVVVTVGTSSVDSSSTSGVIDWTTTPGEISIVAGQISGLVSGQADLRIVAYSPAWPDGVVLGQDVVNVLV